MHVMISSWFTRSLHLSTLKREVQPSTMAMFDMHCEFLKYFDSGGSLLRMLPFITNTHPQKTRHTFVHKAYPPQGSGAQAARV